MNQGMIIQKIRVSEINPAKYNPRKDLKPGDPEYEKLKKSIQEFGLVEPLVMNRRGNVLISGHQRLKIKIRDGAGTFSLKTPTSFCSLLELYT
jgi:ParB-like chromosome segregation protein Spo0J